MALLACVGWGCSEDNARSTMHEQDSVADGDSIGTLKWRRRTVYRLPGNRFTVEDEDGTVLADRITDWELSERYPSLYARMVSGEE